jgi:DNA-binding NtrC family response regulator
MITEETRATILVVEDETLIRMISAEMLQDAGFKVIEAESADEALEILERAEGVQVLFTDIRMPGSMDGLELAALVHKRWPNIKLLLTSGHRSLAHGEVPDDGRFVPKPYSLNAVVNEIREMLPSI